MLHACLYTICFVFCYTSWHFYAFYRINLLTRCHSASSIFLLFLCFRKATQEIFSELDETKAKFPIFPEASWSPKMRQRGARRRPRHPMVRPTPRPHQGRCGPLVHTLTTSFRLYILSMGKPKEPDQFPQNILQAAVIVDTRLRGSGSSSPHPAGEGNHRQRPSLSPCLPPEWCVSSLP
jgi:hypothetical protein